MLDAKEKDEMRAAVSRLVERANQFIGLFLQEQFEKLDKSWAAAPVAVPPVPRHDEPTCCSEKQVGPAPAADGTDWPTSGGGPTTQDVGEGWRDLGPDEILQDGDEVNNGLWGWGLSLRAGLKAGTELRYRRRVTPVEQPLGACLDEENNELREQVVTLTAEVERLTKSEKIWCEDSAETDTVVRDAARKVLPEIKVDGDSYHVPSIEHIVELLVAEVERMRLRPEEQAAIKRMIGEPDSHPSWAESRCAKLLRDMLKRQGGEE